MPFGLHEAPATFQRMMDNILRGAKKLAAAYLNDVVIYSETWEDHLLHLEVNYANEAANLLANLKADWTPEIAFIHTHCRRVNCAGKPGHGKAIYHLVEHYNL